MKKIHCDNECESTVDVTTEYDWERFSDRNWIVAQRGRGVGNPLVAGPWHFCSPTCAKEFFAELAERGQR